MRCDLRRARDGGMVTAELAACLPVLMLLLAVALSAVAVASARLRAEDAAREAARTAARAQPVGAAPGGAVQVDPGANVRVEVGVTLVRAVASVRAHLLVPFLPPVTANATAVAAREPPP